MEFSEKALVTLGDNFNNQLLINYRSNLEVYLGEILPEPSIDTQPNNKSIYSFPDDGVEGKEAVQKNESAALIDKLTKSIENIKSQAAGLNRDQILSLLTAFDSNWLKPENITFKGDQVQLKCWGVETRYLTYLQEEIHEEPVPIQTPKPTITKENSQKSKTVSPPNRKNNFILISGILLICLLIGGYLFQKQSGILSDYNLQVNVKNENDLKYISGAIVTLKNLDNSSTPMVKRLTKIDGKANFKNLKKGYYQIVASKSGYPTNSKNIWINQNEQVSLFFDIPLSNAYENKRLDAKIKRTSDNTPVKEKWWKKIWKKIFH